MQHNLGLVWVTFETYSCERRSTERLVTNGKLICFNTHGMQRRKKLRQ